MSADQPAFTFSGPFDGQLVATSIHAGHDVRADLARRMVLDEDVRFREEDPFTDRISGRMPSVVRVHRSRFEVDLNRDREGAVYATPDDCWGLVVWEGERLDEDAAEESRRLHDEFYAQLARHLDPIAARGPFVLYDCHSYNHRRDGADAPPAPVADNPQVNLGTGSLDRERFAPVVDAFTQALSARSTVEGPIDVRENVRFRGAHLARWVHERYPGTGCALALEFKKTYMDEWTGTPQDEVIDQLAAALEATAEPVLAALAQVRS